MKVLICGDRNWNDSDTMISEMMSLPPECDTIIHGDARGADKMAGIIGEELGYHVIAVPADWNKYHRAAGPIRNRAMYNEHKPDLVIAFHNNIEESKGTKDMVNYAKSKGCPVKIITSYEE